MKKIKDDFFEFLATSPTSWHSVETISKRLKSKGFEPLSETKSWKLKKQGKYFVSRGGSIAAFILPKDTISEAAIAAAHTDSPSLKIKPHAEFREHNMNFFRVEAYGGPLLSTWFDRDLKLAGQIVVEDSKGNLKKHLVDLENTSLVIPSLAIHLSERKNGVPKQYLDKQEHLCPLIGLSDKPKNSLESLLKKKLSFKKLIAHDLFLVPIEPTRYVGEGQELIAGYRLDNLCSSYAVIKALEHAAKKTSRSTLRMGVFWNHEEVGSNTTEGAASPFFEDLLKRILLTQKSDEEAYYKLKGRSICLSLDVSHAYHPSYKNRFDPQDHPLFDKGPIIKLASSMKYSTCARSAAYISHLCQKKKIAHQLSAGHSEVVSGSTIGPVFSSALGILTLDIGVPLLAMHSTRELISKKDQNSSQKIVEACFDNPLKDLYE